MAYTTTLVGRLLRNYHTIIATLNTRSQQLPTHYIEKRDFNRDPFATAHARTPVDGKARARQIEELHVSILDLEGAFPRLSTDDQELLVKYYIHGETLDELCKERHVTSRGSMQRRIQRALQRYVYVLEH